MVIKTTRHLNLHSKTYADTRADHHGLVHVAAKTASIVPDDVQDHPLFKLLVKDGTITVLKKATSKKPSAAEIEASKAEPPTHTEPEIKPDPDAEPPAQPVDASSQIPQAEAADLDDEDEDEEEDEEEDKDETKGK